METFESNAELFECGTCGNLGLGQGAPTCCEGAMEPVSDDDFGASQPSLEDVLRSVFEMSETELDICLCVMEGGEQTVPDLAAQIDYDRSVISRHLRHLVELGILDRRRRLLEDGGQVYVYVPQPPDVVKRNLQRALLTWTRQATALVDSLSRHKVEAMVEHTGDEPQWKLYQR